MQLSQVQQFVNHKQKKMRNEVMPTEFLFCVCRSTTGRETSRTRVRRWRWFLSRTPVCTSLTCPATHLTWSHWQPSTWLETDRPVTPAGPGPCRQVCSDDSSSPCNQSSIKFFDVFFFLTFSSFMCLQLPASRVSCLSLRWREEVSTYPGELHSVLMDRWKATGSFTSPLLLYKVCTHICTHSQEYMLILVLTRLFDYLQGWLNWWQLMWKAVGSGGWRFGTWSKEKLTLLVFKLSQSATAHQYRQTSLLSLWKVWLAV